MYLTVSGSAATVCAFAAVVKDTAINKAAMMFLTFFILF
jgi:hypothetical protein